MAFYLSARLLNMQNSRAAADQGKIVELHDKDNNRKGSVALKFDEVATRQLNFLA